jgi:hypothetical protein
MAATRPLDPPKGSGRRVRCAGRCGHGCSKAGPSKSFAGRRGAFPCPHTGGESVGIQGEGAEAKAQAGRNGGWRSEAGAEPRSRTSGSSAGKWWLTVAPKKCCCSNAGCAVILKEGAEVVYRHGDDDAVVFGALSATRRRSGIGRRCGGSRVGSFRGRREVKNASSLDCSMVVGISDGSVRR